MPLSYPPLKKVTGFRICILMDPHFFEAGSRSPVRVKSWTRIRIQVKILELSRLEMEQWRAVNAQIHFILIRIRIELKSWIRIWIRISVI